MYVLLKLSILCENVYFLNVIQGLQYKFKPMSKTMKYLTMYLNAHFYIPVKKGCHKE